MFFFCCCSFLLFIVIINTLTTEEENLTVDIASVIMFFLAADLQWGKESMRIKGRELDHRDFLLLVLFCLPT